MPHYCALHRAGAPEVARLLETPVHAPEAAHAQETDVYVLEEEGWQPATAEAFVGLACALTYAMVDPAAQDGSVGYSNVKIIEQELAKFGFQIATDTSSADCVGIGGDAVGFGRVSAPAGFAGVSNVINQIKRR